MRFPPPGDRETAVLQDLSSCQCVYMVTVPLEAASPFLPVGHLQAPSVHLLRKEQQSQSHCRLQHFRTQAPGSGCGLVNSACLTRQDLSPAPLTQVWGCTPAVPALRMLRQEDCSAFCCHLGVWTLPSPRINKITPSPTRGILGNVSDMF